MKFSFFSGGKSGKFLLMNQFLYNNKTHCYINGSGKVTYAIMVTPDGHYDWYWEDLEGKLQTFHFKVDTDIIMNRDLWETWFPIGDKGYRHNTLKAYINRQGLTDCTKDFYKCYPHVFRQDIVVNPLPLLGYIGNQGSKKLNKRISTRESVASKNNLEYVIEELKKRTNFVAYKEDVRHMAYNYFGDPKARTMPYDKMKMIIDNNRAIVKNISHLLDFYGIPFEYFNLDTDRYDKSFMLSKQIPTEDGDRFFIDDNIDEQRVNENVERYMHEI
tara:strand:- start:65 stop:883 length:819 start_codon:yes stop_codon:yes gene_type:complete